MARIHRAIGMGSDKILDALLGDDRDKSDDDDLRTGHSALYAQFWDSLRPQPGAVELVRACAKQGLTVGLASSAAPPEFAALRRALNVDDVVAGATNAGDAEESKPDPDIVQAALRAIGLPGSEAVLIGDTPYDVAAAARAGVVAIAFRSGGWDDEALAGALAVYDGPADLLSRLDGSPLRARAMA
jgi:HAD superfamily hydrolase (TIGR01509 family)